MVQGIILLALAGLWSTPAQLQAAERHWIDPAGGFFTDPGNWSTTQAGVGGASVPGAADYGYFDMDGVIYTVRFPGGTISTPLTYTISELLLQRSTVKLVDDALHVNEVPAIVDIARGMTVGTLASSPVVTTTLEHLQAGSVVIGFGVSGVGGGGGGGSTLNVNGGTFTLTGAGGVSQDFELVVGYHSFSGTATLNVNNGATVNVNGAAPTALVGSDFMPSAGSNGTINVIGSGSTLAIKNQGKLYVGSISPGSLNVLAGGNVTDFEGIVGNEASATGTATVDGTGSTWTNGGDVTVGNGTSGNVTSGRGTLTVSNGGSVTAAGLFFIGSYGTVQGDGRIAALMANAGVISPGMSAGALHLDGAYIQAAAGILKIEIGGTAPGAAYDQFLVSGTALLHGELQVSLTGGFTPAVGNVFTILTATGVTGQFATQGAQLPALVGIKHWVIKYNSNNVQLIVTPGSFEADFDADGDVDGADLVKWKAGFGTATGATHVQGDADGDGAVGGADFLTWQRQLGSVASVAAAALVPEPKSAYPAILALFLAAPLARRLESKPHISATFRRGLTCRASRV